MNKFYQSSVIYFESSNKFSREDTYDQRYDLNWWFPKLCLDTNIFRALPARRCGIPIRMYQKTAYIWISGHRRRLAFDTNAFMIMVTASMGTEIIMKAQAITTNTTLKACPCWCGFTEAATWAVSSLLWFLKFKFYFDITGRIIDPRHLQRENTVGRW